MKDDKTEESVEDLLSSLTPRQQEILIHKFGIDGRDVSIDLVEVAKQYKITRKKSRK